MIEPELTHGEYPISAKIWRRSDDVAEIQSITHDRLILLNLHAHQPVIITGHAVKVWELLSEQRSIQTITNILKSQNAGSFDEIQLYVKLLISSLHGEQLVMQHNNRM